MMIAVAVVAFVVWAGIEGRKLYQLSRYYRQRATAAAQVEIASRRNAQLLLKAVSRYEKFSKLTTDEIAMLPGSEQAFARQYLNTRGSAIFAVIELQMKDALGQADRHARIRSKYERAAARPWLPVEPDPPVN